MPQKKKIKEVKTKTKKEIKQKQKQKQTQIVNVNIEQKTTKSKSKRKNTKKTNDNPVIGTPTKETLYKFQQSNKAPIIMPPIMNNNELLSEMRNILQAHDTRQPIQTTEHNMRAQMANINNLNRLVQQQPQQPQPNPLLQTPPQPQQLNPLLQTPPQPQQATPILPTPPQRQRATPILPTPPQPQQRRNLFLDDGEIQPVFEDTRSPEQRFNEDIDSADFREAAKDNNAKKGIFRRFVNLISPQRNPRLAGRPLDPNKVILELDKFRLWERQGKKLSQNQIDYKDKVLKDAKKYKIPIL